jgi:putative phage-type endonuclease
MTIPSAETMPDGEKAVEDQSTATEERDPAGGKVQLQPDSTSFDRRQGIGSSEAAAVLGLDPFSSPFDVWLEKRGGGPPRVEREEMEWGKELQESIGRVYARRTGRELIYLFDKPFVNADRPWQYASPDAVCLAENLIVEVKNVGAQGRKRWGDTGTDDVPEHFFVQAQYQLSTLGADHIDLAVLFGGNRLLVYSIEPDPALQEIILTRVERFWLKHVVADVPPRMQATERAKAFIAARFPRQLSGMRAADPFERELVISYHELRRLTETFKEHQEKVALQLKAAIGNAEGLLLFDLPHVTWKKTKDQTKINWESVARGLKSLISKDDWETLVGLHTSTKPGYRRLLVPKPVGDDNEEETNGRPEIES